MQVRLTLEYDGTNYCGWQLQRDQDSIQGRLEQALATIFVSPVRVRAAGRTDAGVHALAQVAAARLPRPLPCGELKRALNALLPADIAVADVTPADDRFDPRHDASSRVYEYRILNRPGPSAFEHRVAWQIDDALDLDSMAASARAIIGAHDFAAFRSVGSHEKTTCRTVFESQWTRTDDRLVYRVAANSFLRHMVRTLVAAMVEIGRQRRPAEWMNELLTAHNRRMAPAPAPPAGLFLVEVRYPQVGPDGASSTF